MATIGAGMAQPFLKMSHRGLAQPDNNPAPLPPAGTMTCGTVAHQRLTYLTFISVREVDRCSGSYGSSLSMGFIQRRFDVSFIRGIGVWRRQAQLWAFRKSWVGMDGLTPWASGGQVLLPTGRLGLAGGLRRGLRLRFLEGAPLLSTADMSSELWSYALLASAVRESFAS